MVIVLCFGALAVLLALGLAKTAAPLAAGTDDRLAGEDVCQRALSFSALLDAELTACTDPADDPDGLAAFLHNEFLAGTEAYRFDTPYTAQTLDEDGTRLTVTLRKTAAETAKTTENDSPQQRFSAADYADDLPALAAQLDECAAGADPEHTPPDAEVTVTVTAERDGTSFEVSRRYAHYTGYAAYCTVGAEPEHYDAWTADESGLHFSRGDGAAERTVRADEAVDIMLCYDLTEPTEMCRFTYLGTA